jgi:dephospho-CoA kinase
VLAFSGTIASGKSTLSKAVAASLGWKRISFGDYVRGIAKERGLDDSRETLQNLGQSLIESLGWEDFCVKVLNQGGWRKAESIVIDGVRHVEVLQSLKKLAEPNRVALIFISLSNDERKIRLAARDGESKIAFKADQHSTEVQVNSVLHRSANLVVNGNRSVEELVDEITHWVGQK